MKLVVFASGRGSNFLSICEAIQKKTLKAKIVSLVCNNPNAGVLKIAEEFKVPVVLVPNQGLTRSAHETLVLKELSKLQFDWIVLAGYMRLFTPDFVSKFWDQKTSAAKILNIHPSLLPSFAGKDGYLQALRHGVKVTGVTVHFVGAGLDDGPIIAQETLEVLDEDTEQTLSGRGLKLEHKLYVKVLSELSSRPWSIQSIQGGRPRLVWSKS